MSPVEILKNLRLDSKGMLDSGVRNVIVDRPVIGYTEQKKSRLTLFVLRLGLGSLSWFETEASSPTRFLADR